MTANDNDSHAADDARDRVVEDQHGVEDRLQRQLDDYRLLVESINDLVVKVDAQGRFLFVSPSYCTLFGRKAEDLLGKTFMPLVHEDDRASTATAMQALFRPPYRAYMEQRAMTVDGWRWLAWSDHSLLDEAGEVAGIVGIGRDITEQKRAQLALSESELRYRELFENMGDGVAVYEAVDDGDDFVFVEINRSAGQILRIDRDALVGQRVSQRFPAVVEMGLMEALRRVWRGGGSEYLPVRQYRDARLELWVDNVVFKLPNGEIVAIFEDLSVQKRAEQRLLESEKRLRDSQAYAHVGFWELNGATMRAEWSDEVYRIFGMDKGVPAGPATLETLVHPDDFPAVLKSLKSSLRTGEEHRMEYRIRAADGRERWVDCRARAPTGRKGKPEKLIGFLQDVTERKTAELALQASEERFELAMRGANDGLFDWHLESGEIYFSPRWKSMLGYRDGELPNTLDSWRELVRAVDREDVLDLLGDRAQRQRDSFEIEYHLPHKDGGWVDILARASVTRGGDGLPIRVVGTHVDITARKQAEKEIQHLAFHDSLTGLPNRLLFNETLEQVFATFLRDDSPFAMLLLDLDHFKEVNDNLGHPVGDELLQAVAARISRIVRSSDLLARLGGDEFALIQTDISDASEASVLASKIISEIDSVFELESTTVRTSVSIGIVIPKSGANDSARLMSHADVAMYKAKETGRGTYAFFEDAMTVQLQEEMRLCKQLREALDEDQLFLLYQPQYELATGRLVGVEALLRWRRPGGEVLMPAQFLPLAERRGMIKRLSGFALTQSCLQVGEWVRQGIDFGYIAVNLCASQVNADDFYDFVVSTVEAYGVDPSLIQFEFTESMLMESNTVVRSAINKLAERGFRFAIDDFGTGFASFRYLREFHADKLKIAPEFVADLDHGSSDSAIVQAIIALARSLGMKAVAEGVETEAQVDVLADLGCDLVQGFLFARPAEGDELAALLQQGASYR